MAKVQGNVLSLSKNIAMF